MSLLNESQVKFKQYVFIATYIIVLAYLLLNLKDVLSFVIKVFDILSPLTVGVGIAFILNIPMKLFENKCLNFLDQNKKSWIKKLKRPLAILLTLLFVFGLSTSLILFIIPQLIESVSTLINAIPYYLESLDSFIRHYVNSYDLLNNIGNELIAAWKDFAAIGSKVLGASLSNLLAMTLGITSGIMNFMLSLVLAIYMLSSKEKLIIQLRKCLFAFLKKKTVQKILEIGRIAHTAFYHFIAGQFTEALIIGILCFIGMNVLSLPYALLISVIIAVTSLIPVFGAFIGIIPSAFIILIIAPIKAVWFIIFIIFLQQFEGNIIYPRVVGNSIGLSGLWVMLAMMIGGSTFGLLGMVLGIPLCSILYQLLRTAVYTRLHAKTATKSEAK